MNGIDTVLEAIRSKQESYDGEVVLNLDAYQKVAEKICETMITMDELDSFIEWYDNHMTSGCGVEDLYNRFKNGK